MYSTFSMTCGCFVRPTLGPTPKLPSLLHPCLLAASVCASGQLGPAPATAGLQGHPSAALPEAGTGRAVEAADPGVRGRGRWRHRCQSSCSGGGGRGGSRSGGRGRGRGRGDNNGSGGSLGAPSSTSAGPAHRAGLCVCPGHACKPLCRPVLVGWGAERSISWPHYLSYGGRRSPSEYRGCGTVVWPDSSLHVGCGGFNRGGAGPPRRG